MPPHLTRSGTRKLSDVARHVVVPAGIVSTGYPAVRDKCRDLGIVHDDWQQGLGRLILGKRADEKYAATVGGVVISIGRQVGKTFTIGSIIFALCLLFPGMTAIWTAHRTRTSNETFRAMQAMARRSRIKPFVAVVRSTNGEQEISFRNGSRILFGAREQGFGRGFAEVDVVVFDEAQILTERALEDMVAATNQSKHPHGALLFYMGTPPRPSDPGEVFTNKRAKALAGTSKDMVYVELSADPSPDPDDRRQWVKGNPSYPKRTPEESMLRLRENVGSDEAFIREGLGVWDAPSSLAVIDAARWARLAVDSSPAGRPVFALDMDPARSRLTIAVAVRADDRIHVEVAERRPPGPWVASWLAARAAGKSARVMVDQYSPALSLVPDVEAAGVPVTVGRARDMVQACGAFLDAVANGSLTHFDQPSLNAAVAGARKRAIGVDGGFGWDRRGDADISPLVAVTLAAHGLRTAKRERSSVAVFA